MVHTALLQRVQPCDTVQQASDWADDQTNRAGGQAQIMLFGSNPTPQQIQNRRVELGLTQPYPIQYLDYLGRLIHGDPGQSFISSEPITHEIATQFPDTLSLTVAAMAVAVLIGAPLGFLAGARPHSWLDHLSTGVAVLAANYLGDHLAAILAPQARLALTAGRIGAGEA
jgi:ABC-type dipeptide/oligopeptide/nickel transport system permease component